jgi:hypothetical protein
LLRAPDPKRFAQAVLETETVDPGRLVRVSRHNTKEPYFGKSGGNRFDDPEQKYGTSYFGFTPACAFAETVLHDEEPDLSIGGFRIARSELEGRYVLGFSGTPLTVARLYGIPLKNLGGDGSLSTVQPYDIPQAWSAAVHAHKEKVDGFLYVSRHLNNELALVVFERAKKKFKLGSAISLPDYPGAGRLLMDFHILSL